MKPASSLSMLTVAAFATVWLALPQIARSETSTIQPASPDHRKVTGTTVAVPIYKPPVRGAPGGRVGGGTRSGDQTFTLSVLAPNHTALTGKEQPDLYWYVSKPISTPIVFTLSNDGAKPVVEQTLAPSFDVGIHRDPLGGLRCTARSGQTVSLVCVAGIRFKTPVAGHSRGCDDRASGPSRCRDDAIHAG